MFEMGKIVDRMTDLMENYQNKLAKKKYAHLELLFQAFVQETGLKPSEVELVQEQDGMTTRWYFRKRERGV